MLRVSSARRWPSHWAISAWRGGLGQRHVAREHQRDAVVCQQGQGLLHCVAGAELGLLARELQGHLGAGGLAETAAGSLNLVRAVPGDDHCLARRHGRGAFDDMREQRFPAQTV
jgi:hypothetical protein